MFYGKAFGDGGSINGGFFVLSPAVLKQIKSDQPVGRANSSELAAMGEVMDYAQRFLATNGYDA